MENQVQPGEHLRVQKEAGANPAPNDGAAHVAMQIPNQHAAWADERLYSSKEGALRGVRRENLAAEQVDNDQVVVLGALLGELVCVGEYQANAGFFNVKRRPREIQDPRIVVDASDGHRGIFPAKEVSDRAASNAEDESARRLSAGYQRRPVPMRDCIDWNRDGLNGSVDDEAQLTACRFKRRRR
jgi:hypothetical protein